MSPFSLVSFCSFHRITTIINFLYNFPDTLFANKYKQTCTNTFLFSSQCALSSPLLWSLKMLCKLFRVRTQRSSFLSHNLSLKSNCLSILSHECTKVYLIVSFLVIITNNAVIRNLASLHPLRRMEVR